LLSFLVTNEAIVFAMRSIESADQTAIIWSATSASPKANIDQSPASKPSSRR
jgi:hypothetical protein